MDSNRFRQVYLGARDGEAAAQDELVRLYRERLTRYIERHAGAEVRRRSEPDDLFQATILTMLDRLSTFPEDLESDELCAYVLQLARWKIADVLKKKDREVGESQLPETPAAPRDTRGGPVTRSDDKRWTRQQIDSLPQSYADPMRHFYVEGLSISEIATRMDIKPNLVKQRLARGRDMLRDRVRNRRQ